MKHPVVVRDPLWNTIELDPVAVRIVDSPAYQRLRYIRQLGLAHLVYPGATHTRFDHALGVYHLGRRTLAALRGQGALARVDPADHALVPLAGLLHDIGHYPFSHALEELEHGILPGDHEAVAARFLDEPTVRDALESVAPDAATRIADLIRGRSASPLQGLVSGSLDLDKIEYLKRDARFCGVPYGEVDVDRLIHSLAIVEDPVSGHAEIGVLEKGVAALESLLFAKYQMFRNVYWHHAVRSATVLYRRMVADALDADLIDADSLVGLTDEALLFMLEERAQAQSRDETARRVGRAVACLRERRLPKRAGELKAAEMEDGGGQGHWLSQDSELRRRAEDRIAAELRLAAGEVFLDFPEKPAMFALDLLVRRRSGETLRLGPSGRPGLIGLPQISDELYHTARVLRLFTWNERRQVEPDALHRLAVLDVPELERRLAAGAPLLS